ncbi:Chromo domain-like [Plasmopara halstedii]|uniref:Chromo domain-like n=1 Tax=Plasmopara halstedii TaxID=4781 RepID=A0A0P1B4L2_PLAHL|nr:Chromo domain-like [Plasmopara halstedii]CEG49726.1 Chromo domain-like [Plasmopara halstedii]|eukprot:XP_024586095.1 Chromo domain-like [Plasmopara halstedii]
MVRPAKKNVLTGSDRISSCRFCHVGDIFMYFIWIGWAKATARPIPKAVTTTLVVTCISQRQFDGKRQYLVKWHGYPKANKRESQREISSTYSTSGIYSRIQRDFATLFSSLLFGGDIADLLFKE